MSCGDAAYPAAGQTRERELTMVFEPFGFKHGIPIDADYVFDVRFRPTRTGTQNCFP